MAPYSIFRKFFGLFRSHTPFCNIQVIFCEVYVHFIRINLGLLDHPILHGTSLAFKSSTPIYALLHSVIPMMTPMSMLQRRHQ